MKTNDSFFIFGYDTRLDSIVFWAMFFFAFFVSVTYTFLRWRNSTLNNFLRFYLFLYLFAIISLTVLFRKEIDKASDVQTFLFEGKRLYVDCSIPEFVVNVLMFLPIGFLLHRVFKKYKFIKTFIFGLAFSLTIEVTEYSFKKGVSDINDIVNNCIGIILGSIVSILLSKYYIKYRQETDLKR